MLTTAKAMEVIFIDLKAGCLFIVERAAGRKLSLTDADGKKKTFGPFEFDNDTLSFNLPEATIEKNGKKITKKHIRIRASYDDKGLIMDKQLSAQSKSFQPRHQIPQQV